MNLKQTLAVMTILEAAYPRFYAGKTKEELKQATELWAMMFQNDDAKIVTEAVKSMVCTLEFPPTVADVKKKISLITQPQASSEMEAWNMVLVAIQNANYKAQEMFDALPPICKRIVGSPNQLREWAVMESKNLNTIVQSNFMRSYSAKVSQEKEYNMLPESAKQLKQMLAETTNKMLMEQENGC